MSTRLPSDPKALLTNVLVSNRVPSVDPALIFKGTSGPRDADIAIVGESYGIREKLEQKPFVGQSGTLLTTILGEVGIDRTQCFMTNIVNEQPPGNNMALFFNATGDARARGLVPVRGLYPKPNVLSGLEKLYTQLRIVKPKLVIGFGNYALWGLTRENFGLGNSKEKRKVPTGITLWRGSQLFCDAQPDLASIPFLPTYHPAAVMRQWPWYYMVKHDLQARVKQALASDWKATERFRIRPTASYCKETLKRLISLADRNEELIVIANDLETRAGHIACCGIAWSDQDAICIPFMCVERDAYFERDDEADIVVLIRRLLIHPNVRVAGQNYLYDAQYIAEHWATKVIPWFDTMLAQHCCWPGTPKALHHISSLYCHHHRYWKDEGKEWNIKIPEEQYWTYNCRDAVATWESSLQLDALVDSLDLREQFDRQMQQFPMVLNMMLRGTKVNMKTRARVSGELFEAARKYQERFEFLMPPEVLPETAKKAAKWWDSPIQQAQIFYDRLGIKEIINRKTGARTMNDEALKRIANIEPLMAPIVRALEEYRSISVFQNTFCKAEIDPDDRMRCSFDPAGTETFRWASRKNAFNRGTNLQNLPEGTEDGS